MHLLGREISSDPVSEANINITNNWIQSCSTTHRICRNLEDTVLPTRVIDVGSPDGSKEPFLFISEGCVGRYIALSYCWGGEQSIKTTVDSLEAHKRKIELSTLSQSLQDAVTVTRKLKIQYLWIDALCIIQNN